MKEERYFYQPNISLGELTKDDTQHAVKVLRMAEGDALWLMDGIGTFYLAEITIVSNHRCAYRILETYPQECAWKGHLHIAVAPTKLNDRMEWFVEKATEVGVDELSFLECHFSERRTLKIERMEKIAVAAMKQSRKAWKPIVNTMLSFRDFVAQERRGQKFICHCYSERDVRKSDISKAVDVKPFLLNVLTGDEDVTVLIGPEGDFSLEEVRMAEANGWQSVSLGRSRMRTETAALVAVHLMQIKNQQL